MKHRTVESALRDLLYRGAQGTQESIAKQLRRDHIQASQTTVSRALKRLRAEKHRDADGEIVWRLPQEPGVTPVKASTKNLVTDIVWNDFLIIIHTVPGAAGQVAYLLDRKKPGGILGTIAGDDTVFVAPPRGVHLKNLVKVIAAAF